MQLGHALQFPVPVHILKGDLAAAARVIEEDRVVAGVTGPSPVAAPRWSSPHGAATRPRRSS